MCICISKYVYMHTHTYIWTNCVCFSVYVCVCVCVCVCVRTFYNVHISICFYEKWHQPLPKYRPFFYAYGSLRVYQLLGVNTLHSRTLRFIWFCTIQRSKSLNCHLLTKRLSYFAKCFIRKINKLKKWIIIQLIIIIRPDLFSIFIHNSNPIIIIIIIIIII